MASVPSTPTDPSGATGEQTSRSERPPTGTRHQARPEVAPNVDPAAGRTSPTQAQAAAGRTDPPQGGARLAAAGAAAGGRAGAPGRDPGGAGQAIEKQNATATAEGKPEIKAAPLLALAEELLPRLRTAEWRDRAEAAMSDVDELDLRDLRSVVVGADTAARDDETRQLAASLRQALARRVDEEQHTWLDDITRSLNDGRVVRALRLSSRPPKAGSIFPRDVATRLAESTSASLTADASADRWAAVLDALAFAPIRRAVTPQSVPAQPSAELQATIQRLASRLPEVAARLRHRGSARATDVRPGPGPRRSPAPAHGAPRRRRAGSAAGRDRRPAPRSDRTPRRARSGPSRTAAEPDADGDPRLGRRRRPIRPEPEPDARPDPRSRASEADEPAQRPEPEPRAECRRRGARARGAGPDARARAEPDVEADRAGLPIVLDAVRVEFRPPPRRV